MARWEGGADERLARAAYELYFERGFDDVTIAEIAERAGLTKRTFFRYFADKREVLFSGAAAFQEAVVRAVLDAPQASPRSMRWSGHWRLGERASPRSESRPDSASASLRRRPICRNEK